MSEEKNYEPVRVTIPKHPDEYVMARIYEYANKTYGENTPRSLEAVGFFMGCYSFMIKDPNLR